MVFFGCWTLSSGGGNINTNIFVSGTLFVCIVTKHFHKEHKPNDVCAIKSHHAYFRRDSKQKYKDGVKGKMYYGRKKNTVHFKKQSHMHYFYWFYTVQWAALCILCCEGNFKINCLNLNHVTLTPNVYNWALSFHMTSMELFLLIGPVIFQRPHIQRRDNLHSILISKSLFSCFFNCRRILYVNITGLQASGSLRRH